MSLQGVKATFSISPLILMFLMRHDFETISIPLTTPTDILKSKQILVHLLKMYKLREMSKKLEMCWFVNENGQCWELSCLRWCRLTKWTNYEQISIHSDLAILKIFALKRNDALSALKEWVKLSSPPAIYGWEGQYSFGTIWCQWQLTSNFDCLDQKNVMMTLRMLTAPFHASANGMTWKEK